MRNEKWRKCASYISWDILNVLKSNGRRSSCLHAKFRDIVFRCYQDLANGTPLLPPCITEENKNNLKANNNFLQQRVSISVSS